MVTLGLFESVFTSWGFAAAGLSAISIPIIIHYMNKMHRKPVYWGAMRFVLEAYQKQRSRLKIEQLLLLFVRCCILMFLGLALAGMMLPSGCSFIGQEKRVVHLVIDDSLATQVADQVDFKNRFEESKSQALKVIDSLSGEDKVSLTWSANPVITNYLEGTLDRDLIRELIKNKTVRHSKSQLDQAIDAIAFAIKKVESEKENHYVTVFSGFTKDTIQLNNERRRKLSDLAKQARFVFSSPSDGVENYQITHVTPDWRMQIYLEGTKKVSVPVELGIRRFTTSKIDKKSEIKVVVYNADQTKVIAEKKQAYQWASGQSEDKVRINLVVPMENLGIEGGINQTHLLTIKSSISGEDTKDLISADNTRFTSIELKSMINVAVIDDYSVLPENEKLLQRQWIKLALSPNTTDDANPTSFHVEEIDVGDISVKQLENVDTLMLLRPDVLTKKQWGVLHDLALKGKMIWVHPAAGSLDNSWGSRFTEAFKLKWQLGLESKEIEEGQSPWELSVGEVPGQLSRLTLDWEELLKPVKIFRELPLTVDNETTVWLKDNQGNPMLSQRRIGKGVLFFSSIAIEDQWTNLMIKYLYTALYHETIVTTLGSLGNQQIATGVGVNEKDATLVSGYQVMLGDRWGEITSLKANDNGIKDIKIENMMATVDVPGVYGTGSEDESLKLIVNPDATGGNTLALTEKKLETWFSSWGKDSWLWINKRDPGDFLALETSNSHLAQWLLWAMLVFLFAELVLARWFSHAASSQPSLFSHAVKAIRGSGA